MTTEHICVFFWSPTAIATCSGMWRKTLVSKNTLVWCKKTRVHPKKCVPCLHTSSRGLGWAVDWHQLSLGPTPNLRDGSRWAAVDLLHNKMGHRHPKSRPESNHGGPLPPLWKYRVRLNENSPPATLGTWVFRFVTPDELFGIALNGHLPGLNM